MSHRIDAVAVVGAGAVGSFFGAMLARAGHHVTLIGRAAHVQAIGQEGLRLEMAGRVEAVRVAATDDLAAVRGADLVLFCVKSTDTDSVAQQMAPHLDGGALVLSLQNGVENAPTIARHVKQAVVPAVVYVATEMPEPGCVKHHGRGDLVIGASSTAAARDAAFCERLQDLVAFFASAQVPVRISDDVMAELWSKLMVNCAYNAISGLAQASYAELAAQRSVRELQHTLVREVVALAAAEGVNLPLAPAIEAMERIALAMPAQRSSTAQDMARGKPSEIDHLNGFVARRGRELGIPTPANQTLYALVKLVEAGYQATSVLCTSVFASGAAQRLMPSPEAPRPIPAEFAQALRELGLADSRPLTGRPLTGGVSSDIWRIDTEAGPVCAKRALAKLRVAADWHAPIERNRYEARWMQVANLAVPGCAPQVLGQHPGLGVLVMSYLPPPAYPLWKQTLREGRADVATARAVGAMLACIHGYSAARPELAAQFDTDTIFFDIRLEPYLLATAQRHPALAPALQRLVVTTQAHAVALVHGDVSPKNILVGPQGPVLLDAECAWWGDPAFDIAFCLNHLLLKCLWNAPATAGFLKAFDALGEAYLDAVDWEPRAALERRAAALLPGLLLARVDGKSPVEYLRDEAQRDAVRRVAVPLLRQPVDHLQAVRAAWLEEIER